MSGFYQRMHRWPLILILSPNNFFMKLTNEIRKILIFLNWIMNPIYEFGNENYSIFFQWKVQLYAVGHLSFCLIYWWLMFEDLRASLAQMLRPCNF